MVFGTLSSFGRGVRDMWIAERFLYFGVPAAAPFALPGVLLSAGARCTGLSVPVAAAKKNRTL